MITGYWDSMFSKLLTMTNQKESLTDESHEKEILCAISSLFWVAPQFKLITPNTKAESGS